jgi:hypothetical protein
MVGRQKLHHHFTLRKGKSKGYFCYSWAMGSQIHAFIPMLSKNNKLMLGGS